MYKVQAKASHREIQRERESERVMLKSVGLLGKRTFYMEIKYCPYLRFHLLIVHCLLLFFF